MRQSSLRYVLIVAIAAFLIRLAFVLIMRDISIGPCGARSDDDVQFNRLAMRLADGTGYVNDRGQPTSFRAPGYPLFLAGIYAVGGTHPPLVYVVNSLLGALSCVLTYLVARELVPENLARWAGAFASVYLGHIYFATYYISENLFVPCLAIGVLLVVRYLKDGTWWYLILAGLVLGYATLTRPLALLLVFILPAIMAGTGLRKQRAVVVPGIAFATAFLVVILPWTYRNYQVFGRFVLIATNGGSTFYGGNNRRVVSEPRLFGSWISTTELPHRDWIDAQPDEVSHDKMEWKLGIDWLKENPTSIPLLCVYKLGRLWWLPEFDAGKLNYLLRIVAYAPFAVLFLLSAIRIARDRAYWKPEWLAIHGTMLATMLTALIFWGSPRFRDANLPFLLTYAAVGAQALFARKRPPKDEAADSYFFTSNSASMTSSLPLDCPSPAWAGPGSGPPPGGGCCL
jgi:4-amino-4-deoxy-L-arabinose transferase-like glycosyltransferase